MAQNGEGVGTICSLTRSPALSWALLGLGQRELWALEQGLSRMCRSSTRQEEVGGVPDFKCLWERWGLEAERLVPERN